MRIINLSLGVAVLAGGGGFGAPPGVPEGVEIQKGIVYGTGRGHELTLDLYRPKVATDQPRPAMVFVHGGAWKGGNPNQFRTHAITLAGRGWVAASIRYRLLPAGTFPTSVEDAKCAVRWMRANAGELGVDPDRIAAGGGSAGGHLSAMVAFAAGFEGEGGHPEIPSRVCAYVGFNPVMDFVEGGQKNPKYGLGHSYLDCLYTDDPELWATASPLTHIKAGAPPSLFMYGDRDPHAVGGRKAVEKLQALGVPAELLIAEGQAHAFFNKEPWLSRCIERMEQFLARHVEGD